MTVTDLCNQSRVCYLKGWNVRKPAFDAGALACRNDNGSRMAKTDNGSLMGSSRLVPREVHLRDLIAVVIRHWRIVVLLGLLVPAGAYFSGRRSVPRYQSRLTVQVSSQKQVYSQWEDIRVDEMALKTDPVLSEALVLTTQRLALRVVDALRLRLELRDQTLRRSDFFADITIDSAAVPGTFDLVLKGPVGFELRGTGAEVLSKGTYSDR